MHNYAVTAFSVYFGNKEFGGWLCKMKKLEGTWA